MYRRIPTEWVPATITIFHLSKDPNVRVTFSSRYYLQHIYPKMANLNLEREKRVCLSTGSVVGNKAKTRTKTEKNNGMKQEQKIGERREPSNGLAGRGKGRRPYPPHQTFFLFVFLFVFFTFSPTVEPGPKINR